MFAQQQTRGSESRLLRSETRLVRTRDVGLIRRIVTEPRNWEAVRFDGMPPREKWQPEMHDLIIYLALLSKTGEALGLFALMPRTPVAYNVHVNMLKGALGELARDAMKEMFAWMWANTKATRLIGEIPEYNKLALKFAMRAGMRSCGFQPHMWQRDGKSYAAILCGISRPGAGY